MANVGAVVRGVVAAALRDVLGGPDASPGGADARAVAALLSRAQHVIVMAGAGLSTAAGIPDFRTPGTGLYYQLEKYALPDPQAVFDIGYFRQRPEPFHMLAREMWPGKFAPTDAHAFIRLLSDQGRLLRCYTQNIDGLERLAGVPAEKLVECHGTFASARAIDPPKAEVDIGWYRAQLDGGSTQIRCPDTDSLIKPVRAARVRLPDGRRNPPRERGRRRLTPCRAATPRRHTSPPHRAASAGRTLSSSASRCPRTSCRACRPTSRAATCSSSWAPA